MRTFALLLLLLLLATSGAASAADPPNVKTLMTPEDFSESGLDKLSAAELEHLSEWVERYREGAVVGPVVKKKPSEMNEEEKSEYQKEMDAEIVAKVVPAFTGWSGKTVFRLDNGQIWQQRMPGTFRYEGGESTVILTRNLLGRYVMTHEASDRSIGVKRVE